MTSQSTLIIKKDYNPILQNRQSHYISLLCSRVQTRVKLAFNLSVWGSLIPLFYQRGTASVLANCAIHHLATSVYFPLCIVQHAPLMHWLVTPLIMVVLLTTDGNVGWYRKFLNVTDLRTCSCWSKRAMSETVALTETLRNVCNTRAFTLPYIRISQPKAFITVTNIADF